MKFFRPILCGLLAFCLPCPGGPTRAAPGIAVIDFAAPAGDPSWTWAEGGVADLLQMELERSGIVTLDRDFIRAVLSEQRLAAGHLTEKNQLSVSSLLNAPLLITGDLVPLGAGRVTVHARVFSVEAMETVITVSETGAFPAEMSTTLQKIAQRLEKTLRGLQPPGGENHPAGYAPKPESLIMFYRGLNACARGRLETAVAWFIEASWLDAKFTAPLLWEIKAYEMAGLDRHAAIRRQEIAPILEKLGVQTNQPFGKNHGSSLPVFAVLHQAGSDGDAAARDVLLQQALLKTGRIRLFSFENIGPAIAEQDLQLSSFFNSHDAPHYGRWLLSDGLVVGRFTRPAPEKITVDLAIMDPVTATVTAQLHQAGRLQDLDSLLAAASGDLIEQWQHRLAAGTSAKTALRQSPPPNEEESNEMRPAYRALAQALADIRREPNRSDLHHRLADAFGGAGRNRLSAMEVEDCIDTLDWQKPHAELEAFGLHRWLFLSGPIGADVSLVSTNKIAGLVDTILHQFPDSLAAGCMWYNLARADWTAGRWENCRDHAARAQPILEASAHEGDGHLLDRQMIASADYLEAGSLLHLQKTNDAIKKFTQIQEFIRHYSLKCPALPIGPYVDFFQGAATVHGFGGDVLDLPAEVSKQLALLTGASLPPPPKEPEKPSGSAADQAFAALLKLDEKADQFRQHFDQTLSSLPPGQTNVPPAVWIKLAQLYLSQQQFDQALGYFRNAINQGAPVMQCFGVGQALIKYSLAINPQCTSADISQTCHLLQLPAFEPFWSEWFNLGRENEKARHFDQAATCYRHVLDFLEHPEKSGLCHLEKQPPNRTALLWSGGSDYRWSQQYDTRWYSTAYSLAQCLVQLQQKEEAARWFRKISLNLGAESVDCYTVVTGYGNGGSYNTHPLGILSAEILEQLHQTNHDDGKKNTPASANR